MLLGMAGEAHWNTKPIISYAFTNITYFWDRTNMTALDFSIVTTNYTGE
jgi:hypothetical protein